MQTQLATPQAPRRNRPSGNSSGSTTMVAGSSAVNRTRNHTVNVIPGSASSVTSPSRT